MRGQFDRLLALYGQEVVWQLPGGDRQGRAFVQPVRSREKRPMSARTPLGKADQRRWIYIGDSRVPLESGCRLTCQGQRLQVREAMPVYQAGELLYWWAVLISDKEAAK